MTILGIDIENYMHIFSLREWLLLIYCMINVIVFAMYALDKQKARKNKWRIPERTLMTAAVFGIFGAVAGMVFMHHKTQKPKFVLGIPAIALIEACAFIAYFLKGKLF